MSPKNYDSNIIKTKIIRANTCPLNNKVEIRTSLIIPLKRHTASCILMNPSAADSEISDDTINFVTKYIYGNIPEVQRILFYNIYPFYEPKSTDIYKLIRDLSPLEYDNAMKRNRQEIMKSLKTTTYLFLGYGECSGDTDDKSRYYDKETAKLLKMIEKNYKGDIFVFETSQTSDILIKNKFPRHPKPNNPHKATKHHKCYIKNGTIILD